LVRLKCSFKISCVVKKFPCAFFLLAGDFIYPQDYLGVTFDRWGSFIYARSAVVGSNYFCLLLPCLAYANLIL